MNFDKSITNQIAYTMVPPHNHEKIARIVELQRLVWQDNASPLTQLVASAINGGILISAEHEGEIIGFCYGFPGYKNQEIYLFSHMLAVHPDYRDYGIGMQLKLEQKKWALDYGYTKMAWTYDPLEARNGYLNLMKLGGYVRTYIENYYGILNDGLNNGMPTDRFLLEWDLQSEKAGQAIAEMPAPIDVWRTYPLILGVEVSEGIAAEALAEFSVEVPLNRTSHSTRDELVKPIPMKVQASNESRGYLAAFPSAIQSMKIADLELAKQWRFAIREAIQAKLREGYFVRGVLRNSTEPYHFYVLEKPLKD